MFVTVLTRRTLAHAVLLAAALIALAPAAARAFACPGERTPVARQSLAQARTVTLCLLNRERARHGLAGLRANPELERSAQRFAGEMVAEGFFAHVTPAGADLLTRVRSAGGYLRRARGWRLGENLARRAGARVTAAEVVRQWMGSAEHRANVLDPAFRDTGIGIAAGRPGRAGAPGTTWTEQLGRRWA